MTTIAQCQFMKTGLSYDSPDRLKSIPQSTAYPTRYDTKLSGLVWDAEAVDSYLISSFSRYALENYDYCVLQLIDLTPESKLDLTEYRCYYITGLTEMRSEKDSALTQVHLLRDRFAESYSKAVITDAYVTRRARFDGDNEPYSQLFDYKTLNASSESLSFDNIPDRIVWAVLSVTNVSSGSVPTTGTTIWAIPMSLDTPTKNVQIQLNDGSFVIQSCITLSNFLSGGLEEAYGLTASEINHVWLTDTPPVEVTWSNTQLSLKLSTSSSWHIVQKNSYFVFEMFTVGSGKDSIPETPVWSVSKSGMSTSKAMLILSDSMRDPVGSLPNDVPFTVISKKVVVNPSACYVEFLFDDGGSDYYIRREQASARSMLIMASVPEYDISADAFSDYLYSGQREYAITSAKLTREQAYEQGVANRDTQLIQGVSNTISGAGQASSLAYLGSGGGSPFTLASKMAGVNAVAGLGSNAINYWATTQSLKNSRRISGKFDNLSQKATDNLYRHTVNQAVLGGSALNALMTGLHHVLTTLTPDARSLNKQNNIEERFGYSVDEFYPTLPSIVGYLQCSSCNVQGVPPEAKTEIKEILTSGVRILG